MSDAAHRIASRYLASRRNGPVPRDSNWHVFATHMDIGVLDMDDFADRMGYRDFADLDVSIGPAALFRKRREHFLRSIRQSSLRAEDMEDADIQMATTARR